MKIQSSGEQMQIKTGGVSMLVLGVVFVLVGGFATSLPFIGLESDNGEPVPKWASLLGLIFVAVGVFAASSSKKRVITLIRAGESNITDTKMIGGDVKSQNFQTADVAAVNLSTRSEYVGSSSNSGGSRSERVSDLHLILNDNSTIEITSSGQSGFSMNGINMTSLVRKAPLSKEAEQIAGFLGVQVKYEDSSSLQGIRDLITGKNNNQPAATTPPLNPDAPANQPNPSGLPPQPAQTPQNDETTPPQNKPEQQ